MVLVRGHFSRSRGLDVFCERFGNEFAKGVLDDVLHNGPEVRVLEIGCGEGRLLMDLRKRYPDIELHGINKGRWPAMNGQKSLRRTGVYYKIFRPSEIGKVKLPKIHFYDAKKLRFKDNYFDLVVSQVAIPYFPRKDILLEEIWRVLKFGGVAMLNIDGREAKMPDFLDFETPRFIIYDSKGKVYSVSKLMQQLHREGYDVSYRTNSSGGRKDIFMHKNKRRRLNLGLEYDPMSSFDLNGLGLNDKEKLPNGQSRTRYSWGFRSVYGLK